MPLHPYTKDSSNNKMRFGDSGNGSTTTMERRDRISAATDTTTGNGDEWPFVEDTDKKHSSEDQKGGKEP